MKDEDYVMWAYILLLHFCDQGKIKVFQPGVGLYYPSRRLFRSNADKNLGYIHRLAQASAFMYSMRSREYDVAGAASTSPFLSAVAYRAY